MEGHGSLLLCQLLSLRRGVLETAMGYSLFDAAANALDFFCAPHWKGPRPQRDTILHVTVLGDQARYRVLAGRVERWAFERSAPTLRCGIIDGSCGVIGFGGVSGN